MPQRWLSRTATVIVACSTTLLAVLAARADLNAPDASVARTLTDVAVGVAFVAVGVAAPAAPVSRVGMAAVGATWLLGSFVPSTRLLHQAGLLAVLATFPGGRLPHVVGWLLVVGAVPVGFELVPQVGVAALFAAVALYQLGRVRIDAAAWHPVASAGALATFLGASWFAARADRESFDPSVALLVYELILLSVAAGFAATTVAVGARRRHLADTVLADPRLVGLGGLSAVLGDVLDDTSLAVYRWDETENTYVDDHGRPPVERSGPSASWLPVDDGRSAPLGAVSHRSPALTDPTTATAVAAAVRLYLTNLRHRGELQAQIAELAAARRRFAEAVDRRRALTAAQLRGPVVGELQTTHSGLRVAASSIESPEAADAVAVVLQELDAAAEEIVSLVAGVPTVQLGGGRLAAALDALGRRCPLPTRVVDSAVVAADPDIETTLYYVCSEAIANAVKHASATGVAISVTAEDATIGVAVRDDGCGGADPAGTGLQGLADRVAARGGRLQVVSPPGAGTTVTARIPVKNASGQAIFCQGSSTRPTAPSGSPSQAGSDSVS